MLFPPVYVNEASHQMEYKTPYLQVIVIRLVAFDSSSLFVLIILVPFLLRILLQFNKAINWQIRV